MPRMPRYDWTINNVRMNDPEDRFWVLDGSTLALALTRRSINSSVAGRDGSAPWFAEDLDNNKASLVMAINQGNGVSADEIRSALFHLLNSPNALDIRRTAYGKTTQADGKLVSISDPQSVAGTDTMECTVILDIPGVYFRDERDSNWSTNAAIANGAQYPVTIFDGGHAPIKDALVRITGPVENPGIKDVNLGVGFTFRTLTGTERVIIDCSRYTATVVTTDTWDVTTGTDESTNINAYGPGSASFPIVFNPRQNNANLLNTRVTIELAATGTPDAGSRVEIRGRRAYL